MEGLNGKGHQVVDESEKHLTAADLRASKLNKLAATTKLVYQEAEQNLTFESTDVLNCWKEFTEHSLAEIEAENKMWLDIMNRGRQAI